MPPEEAGEVKNGLAISGNFVRSTGAAVPPFPVIEEAPELVRPG